MLFTLLLCSNSTESSNKEIIQTNQLGYLLVVSKQLQQIIESSAYGPKLYVLQIVNEMQDAIDKTVISQQFNNQTQEHLQEWKKISYHTCQLRFLELADIVQHVYMETEKQFLPGEIQDLPKIIKEFAQINYYLNNLSQLCQSNLIINPLHNELLDIQQENANSDDGLTNQEHVNYNQEECIHGSLKLASSIEIILKKSLKSLSTDRELFQHTIITYESAQTVFQVCGLSKMKLPFLSFDLTSEIPCFEGLTSILGLLVAAGRNIYKLQLFSFTYNMKKINIVLESMNQLCQHFKELKKENISDYCYTNIELLQQMIQELVGSHQEYEKKNSDDQFIVMQNDAFSLVRQLWQLRRVCQRYQEDFAFEIDFNLRDMFCPKDIDHLAISVKQVDTCSSTEGDSHAKQTLRFFADQVVSTLEQCNQSH